MKNTKLESRITKRKNAKTQANIKKERSVTTILTIIRRIGLNMKQCFEKNQFLLSLLNAVMYNESVE